MSFDESWGRLVDDPLHHRYNYEHDYRRWWIAGEPSPYRRQNRCQMFGCIVGHTEACYDYGNRQRIDGYVSIFRAKQNEPNAPLLLKMKCFNRDEADGAETYAREKYPDVPFFATYLEWPNR